MVAPDDLPREVWMPVSLQAFRAAVNIGAEEEGDVRARKVDDNIYVIYHRFECFAGLEGNRMVGNRIECFSMPLRQREILLLEL